MVVRIDYEPLGATDLPLLSAQPALGFVEQLLEFAILAGHAGNREARALPHVVMVDLGHGRADAPL